eukprot:m.232764 g.232764  ORF g.232764 m.232764 type:complete len:65 (-) comp17078_c1_seq1:1643-1837(-)
MEVKRRKDGRAEESEAKMNDDGQYDDDFLCSLVLRRLRHADMHMCTPALDGVACPSPSRISSCI